MIFQNKKTESHCLIDFLSPRIAGICTYLYTWRLGDSETRRLGDFCLIVLFHQFPVTVVLKYLHLMNCDFVETLYAFALADAFID